MGLHQTVRRRREEALSGVLDRPVCLAATVATGAEVEAALAAGAEALELVGANVVDLADQVAGRVPVMAAPGVPLDHARILVPIDAKGLWRSVGAAHRIAVCTLQTDSALFPAIAEAFVSVLVEGLRDVSGQPTSPALFAPLRAAFGQIGFVGAIEPPDVPRLMAMNPTMLLVRGARFSEVAAVARHPVAHGRSILTDRVFVRDHVVPMRIGVYAYEYGLPQRVRFTVEVDVERLGRAAAGVGDVFSYDVVTDGIARIAAKGHVELVETLAEQVAALALAHPRARAVRVRVEKLDIIDGAVGIEIVRDRSSSPVA